VTVPLHRVGSATRSMAPRQLRVAHPLPTSSAEPALDLVLELLERRELSAAELRILLAVFDREATVSELAESLRRDAGEIRRIGARLYARGFLRRRHESSRMETVVGITRAGLATVRPLLSAAGDGDRSV